MAFWGRSLLYISYFSDNYLLGSQILKVFTSFLDRWLGHIMNTVDQGEGPGHTLLSGTSSTELFFCDNMGFSFGASVTK